MPNLNKNSYLSYDSLKISDSEIDLKSFFGDIVICVKINHINNFLKYPPGIDNMKIEIRKFYAEMSPVLRNEISCP